MKIKKSILLVIALCLFRFSFSQNYPAFSVTAYDSASTGYYFLVATTSASSGDPVHMIVDSLGRVVYYKPVTAISSGDFKIQPNGLMSFSKATKFYLMDSTFTIVDSVRCMNGVVTDTHDMQILPNGHFLMLGYEYVTMDLSMYNYFGPNNDLPGNSNANVRAVVIQELDSARNVVFEWHSVDHFAFTDVDPRFLGSPLNVDWTHSNSVELDNDGNILLSSRHFDEVTKINRSDSSVMWRLGGNANQFTFINDTFPFLGQHDARRIANGHLTLNDNGHPSGPGHYAAAKEYMLDENLHTATLAWSYVEDTSIYSVAMGNVQRLANGNTLVNYGNTPNSNIMFNVVDPAGNKIFELTFDDTLRSYRAFNYPQLPWTLSRPVITCSMSGNQLLLDAGNYAGYQWSTGDSTQIIAVNTPGTYAVFVPDGHGGFISSDFLVISDPANYCTPASTETLFTENKFDLYPNPVTNELQIALPANDKMELSVQIVDAMGECVFSEQEIISGGKFNISVNDLSPGIYYVLVNGNGKKFVKL
jgi:hypothetical protein